MSFLDDILDETGALIEKRLNRKQDFSDVKHPADLLEVMEKLQAEVIASKISKAQGRMPDKGSYCRIDDIGAGVDSEVGDYTKITGTLQAKDNMRIGDHAKITGVLRAGNRLIIGDYPKLHGHILAGDDFFIGDHVKITGLLLAGDVVSIRDYGYIRGPAILGDNVSLSCELKNSIILEGTNAVHRSIYIGDSIIGRNCNFGAGTQIANLRFDGKEITTQDGYESGRNKLGALVEHGTKTGVNAVIAPGRYLPENSRVLLKPTSL